jgi:hypothetical protein
MRAQLLEYFPALERAFDFAHRKGALILLTGYQTPDGLRRMGAVRLERCLLGAELLAATNGDLSSFNTADMIIHLFYAIVEACLMCPNQFERALMRERTMAGLTAARPAAASAGDPAHSLRLNLRTPRHSRRPVPRCVRLLRSSVQGGPRCTDICNPEVGSFPTTDRACQRRRRDGRSVAAPTYPASWDFFARRPGRPALSRRAADGPAPPRR